ncbi:MAG: ABC transporter permease, partial [Clostridia bacterium]|nr:ABC transporter permease [Clostridia bacterium]
IGSIVVLFTIAFFASRPLFFKMASSPFEYKKKLIKKNYYNKKRKMFHSSVLKEVKTSLRRSEFIYNMVAVIVVLPIAIFLLNKIFNAMNTKLLGTYMTFSFNVLLILLILLASNAMMASAHSSEGRSAYLMKAVPHKHSRYLFPKLIVSMVLTSVSALATAIIFGVFGKIGVLSTIMLYIMIMSFYVGHLFWSAELDIMNPQNEQYATTGSVANNPNERKSTILAFVISILAFLISLFLFNENISVAWVKLAIIGVVFAVARIYLYFTRIKVYYAEK